MRPKLQRERVNGLAGFLSIVLLSAIAIVRVAHATDLATNTPLHAYIGLNAQRLIDDLGDPLLHTPDELWYSNGPKINGGHPGAPHPAINGGRNEPILGGAGGNYSPLHFARNFCNMVIKIDRAGLIVAVEEQGPGCFEYFHRLKHRYAQDPPPP